jgi:hypothetical protein
MEPYPMTTKKCMCSSLLFLFSPMVDTLKHREIFEHKAKYNCYSRAKSDHQVSRAIQADRARRETRARRDETGRLA